jgi:hypothetical protein
VVTPACSSSPRRIESTLRRCERKVSATRSRRC